VIFFRLPTSLATSHMVREACWLKLLYATAE